MHFEYLVHSDGSIVSNVCVCLISSVGSVRTRRHRKRRKKLGLRRSPLRDSLISFMPSDRSSFSFRSSLNLFHCFFLSQSRCFVCLTLMNHIIIVKCAPKYRSLLPANPSQSTFLDLSSYLVIPP